MAEAYSAPTSGLLERGDVQISGEWPDYPGELGLGREHVPELIRMATDPALYDEDPDSPRAWGPLHAWRALAQLGAGEAAGPLLGLLEDENNTWADDEMPRVMQMMGKGAVPGIGGFISDSSRDEFARGRAVESLQGVVEAHPDARDEAVAILKPQLDRYRENGIGLNGRIIKALIELGAKDAAPVMIRAYNEHQVDSRIVHWDRIQEFAGSSSTSA
jgi:HEAT repeat protein